MLEIILFPYSYILKTPNCLMIEGAITENIANAIGEEPSRWVWVIMGSVLVLGCLFASAFEPVFLLGAIFFHAAMVMAPFRTRDWPGVGVAQIEESSSLATDGVLWSKLLLILRGNSDIEASLAELRNYPVSEYQRSLAGAIQSLLATQIHASGRVSAASVARLNEVRELKGQIKLQESWRTQIPFWDEYEHASILASVEDPRLPCPQIIEFNEMRNMPNLPVTPRGTEQILLLMTDVVFVEIETYQTGQTFGESQGTIQGSTSGGSVNWGSDVSTSSGSFSGTQHSYSQSQTTMRDQQAWGDLISGSFIVTSRSLAFRSDDSMVHRSLEFSEIAAVNCLKPGQFEGILYGGMIIDRPDRPRLAVISSYHASLLVRHIVSSENLSDEIEIPIKKMVDEANPLSPKTPLPEPDVKQPSEEPKVTGEAGSVSPKADSAEPDASRSPEDVIGQLERLSKLQESGVITAAELEEQKKRLLNN